MDIYPKSRDEVVAQTQRANVHREGDEEGGAHTSESEATRRQRSALGVPP